MVEGAAFVALGCRTLLGIEYRKEGRDAGAGATAGAAGAAGSGGQGGSSIGGAAGSAGGAGAAAGTSAAGGSAGAVGGGGLDGSGGSPTLGGLILIGGKAPGDAGSDVYVLSLLSADDGHEIRRDTLGAAALAHDGATDTWFIFESPSHPASDTSHVILHAWQFDPAAGDWKHKGSKDSVPPPRLDTIAVLSDRIAYVSYSGPSTFQLTMVDTSNLTNLKLVTVPSPDLVSPKVVAGSRYSGGAVGGYLSVGTSDNCVDAVDGGAVKDCELNFHSWAVAGGITPGPTKLIASYLAGAPGATGNPKGETPSVVALPPVADNQKLRVLSLNPSNNNPNGAAVEFGNPVILANVPTLAASFAFCENAALIVDLLGKQIHAVSLGGGGAFDTKPLVGNGVRVLYEPFTHSALAPWTTNTHGIAAFEVKLTNGVPTLTERNDTNGWTPPTDLKPNVTAVRIPIPFTCQ